MHDYIVGGLARSHQDDLMQEVLREELLTEARHARDASSAAGHAGRQWASLLAHLHVPHLHAPHMRVAHHR